MSFAAVAVVGAAVIGGVAANNAAKKSADAQKASASQLSETSLATAGISKQIADADRAETSRQYDQNMAVAAPVVGAQLEQMRSNTAQGEDYYSYLKSYRPAERSMLYESMGLTPDEAAQMESIVSSNEQSRLSETGYLRGQEAELADLARQLGMTDETVTEENLSRAPDAQPQQKKKKGFLSKLKGLSVDLHNKIDPSGMGGALHAKIIGADGKPVASGSGLYNGVQRDAQGREVDRTISNGWIIDKIVKDNPEYAAIVGKMTEAQKALFADQIRAEMEQGQRELDYNNKLSTLGTAAAKRRQAELDAGKALDEGDARLISGSDSEVLDARRSEIDDGVGRAVADSQGAFTRNVNQSIREGLRYGLASDAIGANSGDAAVEQARITAASANAAREAGIGKVRGQAETRLNLRRNIRDDVTRQKAIDWAKKLDSTGIAKGLPGASAGAYGLALSAGNSAVDNQVKPGVQYTAGVNQSNNVLMQGRQLAANGLSSVLGSNTSLANTALNSQMEMYGSASGAAMKYGLSGVK